MITSIIVSLIGTSYETSDDVCRNLQTDVDCLYQYQMSHCYVIVTNIFLYQCQPIDTDNIVFQYATLDNYYYKFYHVRF